MPFVGYQQYSLFMGPWAENEKQGEAFINV